ncbi:hypothetical protein WA026_008448 [Henosepilachna vigintioctopunctata]|uniref:non-specific serine/threonine protein kinase n=1 Tax=Henosepilachna vigintioctopunctata TaxID=420089 RepID=A0AAW1UBA3_9CUCU
MDIFSAGCALLELWNELHVPFEYSQLLAYREGKYSPQKHLDKLEDINLRALVASMIQIDPSKRLSAEDYLAQERGKLFPEYFFSFLQSYMLIFSASPTLTPDEKILRLKNDIGSVFKFLGPIQDEINDEKGDFEKDKSGECEGLVIITSLVTSCIRGLYECSSKLYSLEIVLELAMHANDETILDRILPYIMFLAHDSTVRVKIVAINTITKCLGFVKKVPRSDANIFPEYILPGLSSLATDSNTCVRAAYAKNIASLADIALRYLEQIQSDWYDQLYTPSFNYELELQALHEMVQQTVSSLLTDPQTLVKQTLMDSGITNLCVFFGKQKANDVILSHMITFLNDKEDKELRGSFFDCIIGVATYIGWHCSIILAPLLVQGLKDTCEFVTVKSINAMSRLTELGLLNKPSLCELISESACFLVHPNLWIRQAVAGFMSTAAKVFSVLDVQCKLIPKIQMFMKYPLIQIEEPVLLLESLVSPVPRTVYDSIIAYSDIDVLLDIMKLRRDVRKGSISVSTKDIQTPSLKNVFRRLESIGMTEEIESYILKMGPHLQKIHKFKTNADAWHNRQNEAVIEISSTNQNIRGHVFNLTYNNKTDYLNTRKLTRTNTSGSIDTNVNSDWNYSSEVLNRQSESTNSVGPSSRTTNSRPSSPPLDSHSQFGNTEPSSNMSLHERSYIQCGRSKSKCYIELMNLKARQQQHYFEALRGLEWAEQTAWQPQLPPPGWRLRGTLVAHMHEHKSAVTRLAAIPDTSLFASSSTDGYVRLWDCSKLEGKNIANRSKQQFKMQNGIGIIGITACDGGQSVAAASQDGSINILRIEPASNKLNLMQSRYLNLDEDGFAIDINCIENGSQSVVVYATTFGSLVGWDLRCPGIAWRLDNDLKNGFITSFCLDNHHNWLTLGTRNGTHIVWDLRFKLPITTIKHTANDARIKKVTNHPTESSWIISSVQGNNEISMWNLETGFREKVLWGNSTPPLSNFKRSQESYHTVCAIQTGCTDSSPFVITGGTDQRVRFWDLESTQESYLAIPAASDHPGLTVEYTNRLIDGTDVTYEETNIRNKTKTEEIPRAGPEPPATGHKDTVSDIVICKATQAFVVTSSRDGVIKVWK